MPKKTIGFALIVLGATMAVVSLAADGIGIGTQPGINGLQLLGAAIGLIVALVGVWLAWSKPIRKK